MKAMYKWLKEIMHGNGMRNTLSRLAIYHILAFAILWNYNPEISVLPLGGLLGLSACTIFYSIDRRGFDEVNTIELFKGSSYLYFLHLGFYWSLILAGYALSWYALR